MRPQTWIAIGAVLAGLGVAFGAFGAHGATSYFAEKYRDAPPKEIAGFSMPAAYKYLGDFETAAEYQMTHAIGILAVGLLGLVGRGGRLGSAAGWCFLAGIVFFSGSLYALTLTGRTWLGAVTPIGGTLFLAGWGLLAAAALRRG